MRIVESFDYRHARSILEKQRAEVLANLLGNLNNPDFRLRLGGEDGKNQDLSKQMQNYFRAAGWEIEKPPFTLPDLRYDMVSGDVPVEIEIGHERLVYAVFFKFLADYLQQKIPAGIMIVTEDPHRFGHSWHNSRANTKRKIEAISTALLVPILVLGVEP